MSPVKTRIKMQETNIFIAKNFLEKGKNQEKMTRLLSEVVDGACRQEVPGKYIIFRQTAGKPRVFCAERPKNAAKPGRVVPNGA